MSPRTTPFNVEITEAQRGWLTSLATQLAISKGAVVRQLISHAHAHTFGQTPTCANGAPCYVPQMHQMARTQAAAAAPAADDQAPAPARSAPLTPMPPQEPN